ncbi:recombination-associated protein RdgC [Maridesulfovibrio sp.]|uniref:recombination-associated protein RdgC n=1 Tax=Maridesulfovibrio sp. TaxID=2795000 RepID=UPI0029CA9D11|nr:recombination-associated protein RdgC [Maridesulfovibrio sp.]
MGRLFKAHPLTVYRVSPEEQLTLLPKTRDYEAIAHASFEDIDELSHIEKSTGTVVFEDYRSTGFGPGNVEFGEYVVFSVRIDERKIPGAALNKQVEDAIDKEMVEAKKEGKNFISRDRKREIKEQVKLRLRAHTVPTPKVADVWWNTKTNLLFLTDKSKGFVEALDDVFRTAFGTRFVIEPLTLGLDEEKNMVGHDFLTSIWNANGTTFSHGEDSAHAFISDNITAADAQETIKVSEVGSNAEFDDIKRAVEDGKFIVGAQLTISYDDTDYEIDVDSALTPILKVSVPAVTHLEQEEIDGAMLTQIDRVETAFGLLNSLVEHWKQESSLEISPEEFRRRMRAGARQAAEDLKGTLPEGTTMTIVTSDGEKVEVA